MLRPNSFPIISYMKFLNSSFIYCYMFKIINLPLMGLMVLMVIITQYGPIAISYTCSSTVGCNRSSFYQVKHFITRPESHLISATSDSYKLINMWYIDMALVLCTYSLTVKFNKMDHCDLDSHADNLVFLHASN